MLADLSNCEVVTHPSHPKTDPQTDPQTDPKTDPKIVCGFEQLWILNVFLWGFFVNNIVKLHAIWIICTLYFNLQAYILHYVTKYMVFMAECRSFIGDFGGLEKESPWGSPWFFHNATPWPFFILIFNQSVYHQWSHKFFP